MNYWRHNGTIDKDDYDEDWVEETEVENSSSDEEYTNIANIENEISYVTNVEKVYQDENMITRVKII